MMPVPSKRLRLTGLAIFLSASLLAGCSGSGSAYRYQPEDVARLLTPQVRDVPYPPDSLTRVSLVENDDRFRLALEGSYLDLHRTWSATWRGRAGSDRGQQNDLRTFATLWSYDLSMAALKAEGALTLTKDRARDFIEERRREFATTIQIDVYRFVGSPAGGINSLSLVGADTRIELRDGEGNVYEPISQERGPEQQGFFRSSSILYRRNIFIFPRVVDGRDVLAEASELQLDVRARGAFRGYSFAWDWSDADEAAR
jgi:hypothetical protein